MKEVPLPDQLQGDELRFKQVLINLIKNAIKFTKRGYIRILAAYDDMAGQIRVQICDSGKGIEPAEIPLLCHQFGKLYRTAEINSDGIGLGLMISKALVEKTGGTLEIFSEGVDRGSVFAFSMNMLDVSVTSDSECNQSSSLRSLLDFQSQGLLHIDNTTTMVPEERKYRRNPPKAVN